MSLLDYTVNECVEKMPKVLRKKYDPFFTSKETVVFMAEVMWHSCCYGASESYSICGFGDNVCSALRACSHVEIEEIIWKRYF